MKELKDILKKRLNIDADELSHRIPPLKLDLEYLKQYGFITQDKSIPGGWRVVPKVFLPFILLNFKREYRSKLPKNIFDYLFVLGYGEKPSRFPFFKFW